MPSKTRYEEVKNKFYLEGGFSFANYTLLTGIFLVGFAMALGADNFQIGILMAIPLLANLLQLVSAFILEATGTRKWTTVISLIIGRGLWIPIILIAFGVYGNGGRIITLMLVLFFSSCFTAIGNLALLSWMKDVVPINKLASFWGKRNIYATAGGISVYLAGSYVIDKYNTPNIYGYIFGFAVLIGFIGILFLGPISEKKQKIKAISPTKWWNRLKMPFQTKEFRPLLWFGVFWGFSLNLASPFFLVFMMDDLGLSFVMISILLLVDRLVRMYGLNVWRSIADKYGAKPLLTVSVTVSATIPLLLVFITPNNYFLLFHIFIISAFSYAAVDIATGQLMFKSAPRKYDGYYLASFTSVTGIVSAIGPILGGFLAVFIKNNPTLPFMDILPPLKYIFILSFIVRVLCIPMISKIEEPKARDVKDILESMKTLKTTSLFVNIYDFAEYASRIVLSSQKQLFFLQRKTVELTRRNISTTIKNVGRVTNSLARATVMKAYHMKKIKDVREKLLSQIQNMEYVKGGEMKKIQEDILSKTKAVENCAGGVCTKKEMKKKVDSLQKTVEKSQKKLDKAYKEKK